MAFCVATVKPHKARTEVMNVYTAEHLMKDVGMDGATALYTKALDTGAIICLGHSSQTLRRPERSEAHQKTCSLLDF